MGKMLTLFAALLLLGCDQTPPAGPESPTAPAQSPPESDPGQAEPEARQTGSAAARLDAILASQPEEFQARYEYRHPQQTLAFFGIQPGMTVVEALPGGGWYSRILVPYLGADGRLVGANYAQDMWPLFGFFGEDFIRSMETWTTDWPEQAEEWQGEDGAGVDAFEFGSMPESLEGQVDAVLFIRALHNLARFEDEGGFLTTALNDAYRALKPGGIVGVVQHAARPDMPDDWADGDAGYLKPHFVIDQFTVAGFEFVADSDINENPNDQPTEEDVVWRLPPSYQASRDDPELQARMDEIGESNRMTLKFRKPE